MFLKSLVRKPGIYCRPTSRGMKVLSRPPLVDSWGQKIAGPSHDKTSKWGCSCRLCSASSMSTTAKDGASKNPSEESDLLKTTMDKNKKLEEEIAELRMNARLFNRVDDKFDRMKQEDPDIAQLLDNNKKWVEEQLLLDPGFFERIGAPQKPKYLYIGCSDSRVPANQILGLGPGEVFVHRNVGNQVIGSDMNCTSAIEFAVKFLNVKHIIVAGHYDCGAVHASMKRQDLGLLENWIRSIRDVYRIHQQAMSLIDCPEERHKKMVELNVIEQCLNLYKTGAVQSKRMECFKRGEKQAYPRVHAMVFDPKVGRLRKLPVNFKKTVSQFKDIYDLY